MRDISAIELWRTVEELREKLEGSHLRKFYDLGNGSFRFLFYKKGSIAVYCRLMRTFNETAYAEEAEGATPFAMGIRKRLSNARLRELKLHGFDRIIEMVFDDYALIIEMFGKGNVLLIDGSSKILLAYKRQDYSDRTLAVGELYRAPENRGTSILELESGRLSEILKGREMGKRLITHLAALINVGPLYIEDSIIRSGIEPKRGDALLPGALGDVEKSIMREKEMLLIGKPRLYISEGSVVDYALCDILKYEGMQMREYATLNELLDALYAGARTETQGSEESGRVLEIRASIEKQRRHVESMNAESELMKLAAERVFANMHRLNELIAYLKEHRRATLDELGRAFEGLGIKKINLGSKKVIVEI